MFRVAHGPPRRPVEEAGERDSFGGGQGTDVRARQADQSLAEAKYSHARIAMRDAENPSDLTLWHSIGEVAEQLALSFAQPFIERDRQLFAKDLPGRCILRRVGPVDPRRQADGVFRATLGDDPLGSPSDVGRHPQLARLAALLRSPFVAEPVAEAYDEPGRQRIRDA
ncbi:MAG TPA: hypothetical protein VG432_12060 [Gemmatimonadaceae bacterium]|nr:hypothetical protein [Gemmatimonadaceae bacterium]